MLLRPIHMHMQCCHTLHKQGMGTRGCESCVRVPLSRQYEKMQHQSAWSSLPAQLLKHGVGCTPVATQGGVKRLQLPHQGCTALLRLCPGPVGQAHWYRSGFSPTKYHTRPECMAGLHNCLGRSLYCCCTHLNFAS